MSGAPSPDGGQPAGHIQETLRDGIATLTISNPARRNAMTLAMWRQLAACWRGCAKRRTCGCWP